MAEFDNALTFSLRLITKKGETSTLRRKVDGTPVDAAKPWEPGTPTFDDTSVKAVWLNYDVNRVDGQLIQSQDQSVTVAAKDLTVVPDPSTDVIVRADGQRWTIVDVRPLNPNGQTIIYELQVRK